MRFYEDGTRVSGLAKAKALCERSKVHMMTYKYLDEHSGRFSECGDSVSYEELDGH